MRDIPSWSGFASDSAKPMQSQEMPAVDVSATSHASTATVLHEFPHVPEPDGVVFLPAHLVVRCEGTRRTALVLDREGTKWRIYDLPATW